MATGGVSATTGGTPSTGGASGGNTAGGGNPSTGGQSQAGDPGTGGSESGGEPGDGGEAGEPSLGGSSGAGGEPSATGGTGATGGGPDDCPSGQMWCPGCTPGTGSCGVACVGAVCPECAQAETLEACDALPNCHPVFRDDRVCGCATVGCCTHFDRCEPGDQALCQAPQTFGCTIDEPYCEGDYVISYTNICYEGCARVKDCSEAP